MDKNSEPTTAKRRKSPIFSFLLRRKPKEGRTFFEFVIDKSIQTFFEEMPHEIRESEKWPTLKFYYVPQITESRKYKQMLADQSLSDNYGAPIIDEEGRFNMAWIRTVGGEGKIEMSESITLSEAQEKIERGLSFIKTFHSEFFSGYAIKAIISDMEIG